MAGQRAQGGGADDVAAFDRDDLVLADRCDRDEPAPLDRAQLAFACLRRNIAGDDHYRPSDEPVPDQARSLPARSHTGQPPAHTAGIAGPPAAAIKNGGAPPGGPTTQRWEPQTPPARPPPPASLPCRDGAPACRWPVAGATIGQSRWLGASGRRPRTPAAHPR